MAKFIKIRTITDREEVIINTDDISNLHEMIGPQGPEARLKMKSGDVLYIEFESYLELKNALV